MKNIKKSFSIKSILLALIFTLIVPGSAFAATVYTEVSRNTVSVGDVFIVAFKINADGKVFNTVDGEISIKGDGAVEEFSLANSAFGLWPRTPSLTKDGKNVSFVGGVPGGFSIEGATIFKMMVQAKKEGVITISPQNVSLFLNDGKGTKVSAQLKGVDVNVVAKKTADVNQNDWSAIVSQDTTPPEDFIIVLGQDPNLYNGKKFVYFSAVDNQSGIDHYDVSENGGEVVKTGSIYVIQNQDSEVKLVVTAYDKAGNKKVSKLDSAAAPVSSLIFMIAIVVIIFFFLYRMFRKTKKNNAK